MAIINVNKYHLISMGLYSKLSNGESNSFSDQEVINFARAYATDARRPQTDFMNNIYKFDFSDVTFSYNDLIFYDARTKAYYSKTNNPIDLLKYTNDITGQALHYLETLGKEKKYKTPEYQPLN